MPLFCSSPSTPSFSIPPFPDPPPFSPTSSAPPISSSSNAVAATAASDYSVSAFRALSTKHIWSLEALLRDAQWRSLYSLSYSIFTTVVDKLKPHITLFNLSLPSDYAIAMVLSRLAHGFSAKTLAARLNPTSSPRSPTWSPASSPPSSTLNLSRFLSAVTA